MWEPFIREIDLSKIPKVILLFGGKHGKNYSKCMGEVENLMSNNS